MDANQINKTIKESKVNTDLISDGYHTFGELYNHRIELYINLCKMFSADESLFSPIVWRSKKHSDGDEWDGWFILGINVIPGNQITYHLPDSKWDDCSFAIDLEHAPKFDGHTSDDVLQRLKDLTDEYLEFE